MPVVILNNHIKEFYTRLNLMFNVNIQIFLVCRVQSILDLIEEQMGGQETVVDVFIKQRKKQGI